MQAKTGVLILILAFVTADDYNCGEDMKCCLLQGKRVCVMPEQFHCAIEPPFTACGVSQCPLSPAETLCSVGVHRYYHCNGVNCCEIGERKGSFIIPAEFINPEPINSRYIAYRLAYLLFIIISIGALYFTRNWPYVRTKNLYIQFAVLISHILVLRYCLSTQPYDSCYTLHFFGGSGVAQFYC